MCTLLKFELGQIVATAGFLSVSEDPGPDVSRLLALHSRLSPGELCPEDVETNREATEGFTDEAGDTHYSRVFSCYLLSNGVRVYVITEADRSSTTFLLPEEY